MALRGTLLIRQSLSTCHGLDLRYSALELRLSVGFSFFGHRSNSHLEIRSSEISLFTQREVFVDAWGAGLLVAALGAM
jgi:hypothetical protein